MNENHLCSSFRAYWGGRKYKSVVTFQGLPNIEIPICRTALLDIWEALLMVMDPPYCDQCLFIQSLAFGWNCTFFYFRELLYMRYCYSQVRRNLNCRTSDPFFHQLVHVLTLVQLYPCELRFRWYCTCWCNKLLYIPLEPRVDTCKRTRTLSEVFLT